VRARSLIVVLAAAVLVPVSAQAADPVVSAAQRSAQARSATMQFRSTTTIPGLGGFVTSGTGAQRGTNARMSLRVTGTGGAVTVDTIALTERGSFVVYMRSPLFRSQLPRGKTWVRVDLQKVGEGLGLDFSALVGASQALTPLWQGVVSTKSLGREVVAGRPATHYRTVVDYRRAAAKLPGFAKQLAALERTAGVRLGRVKAEVWVGRDGRIRRFSTVTPTRIQGVRGTSTQVITYLAYDTPVTVTAPPAAQVFEPPS
jgi:hypothetical protein